MTLLERFKALRPRLLILLAVIGPGIITANVDNDAGGITTYSVSGAHYGYMLLWIMPLLVIALIIVQEMSSRLGVVTGKGLAALLRETLGLRITTLVLGLLVLVNLTNTISEFAGVAASMEIFGISKFISVPVVAVLVWILIVKANYRTVERVFLVASAVYLAYVASGIMANPQWSEVGRSLVTPSFKFESGFIIMAVTIIGTTIAPWMQFYQQSAIVDKGIAVAHYKYARLDVIIGSVFAIAIASFITVACAATLFKNGIRIETAKDAALSLAPLAGRYASILFALGLLNASVFSAAILPLSTAYTVCEAFGFESSVSRQWKQAPIFFWIYTVMIFIGAVIVLLPFKSLVQVMMFSQTLNGLLLPFILIVMLKLVNDKRQMGSFANGRFMNIVSWLTVGLLIGLTMVLVLVTVAPHLLG
jgi:Mn2+/Fe2+ NRAMP family transporter